MIIFTSQTVSISTHLLWLSLHPQAVQISLVYSHLPQLFPSSLLFPCPQAVLVSFDDPHVPHVYVLWLSPCSLTFPTSTAHPQVLLTVFVYPNCPCSPSVLVSPDKLCVLCLSVSFPCSPTILAFPTYLSPCPLTVSASLIMLLSPSSVPPWTPTCSATSRSSSPNALTSSALLSSTR